MRAGPEHSRYATVRAVTIFLFCANLPLGATPQEPQTYAQILVNTAYDDSEASLRVISRLIQLVPPVRVELQRGNTLSEFILNEYGISKYKSKGASYLPKSYALIEAAILLLNDLQKPEDAKAGPILVPNIPKKAKRDYNPRKLANFIPKVDSFSGEQLSIAKARHGEPRRLFYQGRPAILEMDRPASQFALLDIVGPGSQTSIIVRDPVIGRDTIMFNYPLTISLADPLWEQGAESSDHAVLSSTEKKQIQSILMRKANRKVILFILDSGWPDPDSYNESRKQLNEILSNIWAAKFNLKLPMLLPPQPFVPPTNPHCMFVKRALGELRALDPQRQVEIVYVPLTREQDSAPLLTALLQTYYLFQALRRSPDQVPVATDLIRYTHKQAATFVAQNFPDRWSGMLVKTDKSLLDAVLRVGDLLAEIKDTAFFVNESWTTEHEDYFVYYPSPPLGLVLAAVGNLNENINSRLRDFAQRSSTTKDTMAVMNLRPGKGLLCCSSRIDPGLIDSAMAVGYDGEVFGTDCQSLCGTSFAAPRVAWFLAVDEVTRTKPLQPGLWAMSLFERLRQARDTRKQGLERLWFDPIKFLQLPH